MKVDVKKYKTGLCCDYWIFAQKTGLDRTSITVNHFTNVTLDSFKLKTRIAGEILKEPPVSAIWLRGLCIRSKRPCTIASHAERCQLQATKYLIETLQLLWQEHFLADHSKAVSLSFSTFAMHYTTHAASRLRARWGGCSAPSQPHTNLPTHLHPYLEHPLFF